MRLYRALLYLYPASFRAEYGEQMCDVFAKQLIHASSPIAKIVLWLSTFFETVFNATQVHWDILRQDLAYTARGLVREPGFAIATILVAALGIGANTAVFSITDRVLIRPLPFPDSDRIVKLWESTPESGRQNVVSAPNYRDWRRMSSSFESMGAYTGERMTLRGHGDPRQLAGVGVSSEVFTTLSAKPLLGRAFNSDDERAGAPPVMIVSHALWQRDFGGKPDAIGTDIRFVDGVYTLVGVMPADFYFPNRDTEYWKPLPHGTAMDSSRDNNILYVIAKLKKSASIRQARNELSFIADQIEAAYPKENEGTDVSVVPLRDLVDAPSRTLLIALFAAALCVLSIACTNLASLTLIRGIARRKELAVRSALGAGRERLVRQLVTESLLLAILGGIAGVMVAVSSLPLLARFVPESLPISDAMTLDLRVLAFAAIATGVMGLGFGVLPALRSSSPALIQVRAKSGIRRERLRAALLVAQVTGSVVLLISAGLLIRALWSIRTIDPGFRAENVFAVNTPLPGSRYDDRSRRMDFYARVLPQVRALPGVTGAAFISYLPMVTGGGIQIVNGMETQRASMRFVTPGLFSTMGIPIRMGRDISESDNPDAAPVAVVSQSFVRQYLSGLDPIGQEFDFADAKRRIVGVVGEVRVRGLERESEPQVYLPHSQMPLRGRMGYSPRELVVRASIPPDTLMASIRNIIRDVDPELPLSLRTFEDIVAEQTGTRMAHIGILAAFAALSLLLAGLGVHGLLSFAVSQRIPEIGVRIALGASTRRILAMVVRDGVRLASIGCFLGLIFGYAAGRSMESVLAGIQPADIPTFFAAVLLVFLTTVTGSFLPAVRAIRVNPVSTIRNQG